MLPPKIPLFKGFLPGKQSSLHWAVNFRTWLLGDARLQGRRFVLPRLQRMAQGSVRKLKRSGNLRAGRADLHRGYSNPELSFAPDNSDLWEDALPIPPLGAGSAHLPLLLRMLPKVCDAECPNPRTCISHNAPAAPGHRSSPAGLCSPHPGAGAASPRCHLPAQLQSDASLVAVPSLPLFPCPWGHLHHLSHLHTHAGTHGHPCPASHVLPHETKPFPFPWSSSSCQHPPHCTGENELGHQPGWGTKEEHEVGVLEPPRCP